MSCIPGCHSAHFGSGEDEKQVDIVVQTVPETWVIYGQITDCSRQHQPVAGALVKAFRCVDKKLVGICHTFSGGNGYYMLSLPPLTKHDHIVVIASCGCFTPKICASCTPDCPPPHPCGHDRGEGSS